MTATDFTRKWFPCIEQSKLESIKAEFEEDLESLEDDYDFRRLHNLCLRCGKPVKNTAFEICYDCLNKIHE